MVKSIFILVFVVKLFSCESGDKINFKRIVIDSLPTILISGLPDISELNAKNTLAAKHGFQYKFAGSCVVDQKLRDSIDFENSFI